VSRTRRAEALPTFAPVVASCCATPFAKMQVNLLDWYWELPIITRIYFTGTFLLTALCSLDVLSPFQLYYSSSAIARGELWRLVTNFFYFGNIGIDFLFHMYFVCVARPKSCRRTHPQKSAAGSLG
jgi:hypothetical protein